jgi:hypothetical protein
MSAGATPAPRAASTTFASFCSTSLSGLRLVHDGRLHAQGHAPEIGDHVCGRFPLDGQRPRRGRGLRGLGGAGDGDASDVEGGGGAEGRERERDGQDLHR